MKDLFNLSVYWLLAFFILVLCLLLLVDAALPQLQLYFFDRILVSNALVKVILLATVALGSLMHPAIRLTKLPLLAWSLCICYLVADIAYLSWARSMSLGDVLLSYNGYYFLLLLGPSLLAFRDTISERLIVRCIVFLFVVCAAVAIAQHLTDSPLLHTESADGAFEVQSPTFFGDVRAFSLFTSAMDFGLFCALCGALGVALSRRLPVRGAALLGIAAVGCFTTLTRLCYVVFICACSYALVLTYGKKSARGRWYPLIYCALGISTVVAGLYSFLGGDTSNIQDASSLMERIGQWAYYSDLISQSTLAEKSFGLGIVQLKKIVPAFPMVIDNVPLALILHIGLVGLVFVAILMFQMWLYVRREALSTQQPFIIAAASLWATLACAGIFNIVFSSFGIVFALTVLCRKDSSLKQSERGPGSPVISV